MRRSFGLVAAAIVIAGIVSVETARAEPSNPSASEQPSASPKAGRDQPGGAKPQAAIRRISHKVATRHGHVRSAGATRADGLPGDALSSLASFFSGPAFWVYGVAY